MDLFGDWPGGATGGGVLQVTVGLWPRLPEAHDAGARESAGASGGPALAIHTKACVNALGLGEALKAIRDAGAGRVVIFAGESGEHLGGVEIAHSLGLTVVAVAIPKLIGLSTGSAAAVSTWLHRAGQAGAPAATLIFGDRDGAPVGAGAWQALAEALDRADLEVRVENSGRPSELFSSAAPIRTLLDLAPRLRLCLDLGHLTCSGVPREEFDGLIDRVAALDVHENDGGSDLHQALGTYRDARSFREALPRLTGRVDYVVETDPNLVGGFERWIEAIRSDLGELESALPARAGNAAR